MYTPSMTPIIPKRKLIDFDEHGKVPDKSLNYEDDVFWRNEKTTKKNLISKFSSVMDIVLESLFKK